MKKTHLLFFFLLFSGVALLAQSKDEQAIASAVRQLNQAMVDGNQIRLDELTSKKLSYGHSSGLLEDKDAFITAIIDGVSGFTSIDLTEQTISISQNVAVVRHKFSADTDNKGQAPGHINLNVLQVWHKEGGKWLLLARHAARMQ